MPGSGSIVMVSFDEQDGHTILTMNMRFESKTDRDFCLKSGMEKGVYECYTNIDKLIEAM